MKSPVPGIIRQTGQHINEGKTKKEIIIEGIAIFPGKEYNPENQEQYCIQRNPLHCYTVPKDCKKEKQIL